MQLQALFTSAKVCHNPRAPALNRPVGIFAVRSLSSTQMYLKFHGQSACGLPSGVL